MPDKKNGERKSDSDRTAHKTDTGGGAYIGGKVKVGRDLIGRDKVERNNVEVHGNSTDVTVGDNARTDFVLQPNLQSVEVTEAFTKIMEAVNKISNQDDRQKTIKIVEKLEAEAQLGETASEKQVGRWLTFLGEISEDAWEVAVDSFINPVKGLSTVFQKIAKRARAEKKQS